jgi:hypothetical protein
LFLSTHPKKIQTGLVLPAFQKHGKNISFGPERVKPQKALVLLDVSYNTGRQEYGKIWL